MTSSDLGRSGDGYLVLADRIPSTLRAALAREADRYVFTPPHPRAGGAFAMATLGAGSVGADVADWISAAAAANGYGGFVPNEASFQRYEATGNGLPPHRDQRYYATCIAIVTVEGNASFAAHASRAVDDVSEEWLTTPGEVILLRGWSPGCDVDPRPYHRVDPPRVGTRLMFQLRRNLGAEPADTWPDDLTADEREQARSLASTPESPRAATEGPLDQP